MLYKNATYIYTISNKSRILTPESVVINDFYAKTAAWVNKEPFLYTALFTR